MSVCQLRKKCSQFQTGPGILHVVGLCMLIHAVSSNLQTKQLCLPLFLRENGGLPRENTERWRILSSNSKNLCFHTDFDMFWYLLSRDCLKISQPLIFWPHISLFSLWRAFSPGIYMFFWVVLILAAAYLPTKSFFVLYFCIWSHVTITDRSILTVYYCSSVSFIITLDIAIPKQNSLCFFSFNLLLTVGLLQPSSESIDSSLKLWPF